MADEEPHQAEITVDVRAVERELAVLVPGAFPPQEKPSLTEFFFAAVKSKVPEKFLPLFQDFEDKYRGQLVKLEKKLFHLSWTAYLEQRTGIHGTYWGVGITLFTVIFSRLLFKVAASLFTNLVGFVYPAYASIKAIESEEKDDDTQWLTYWTVYGAFNVAEYFSNILLKWIPFYYFAKILVLVWCFHPSTKGAGTIYQKLLRPYFLRYEKQIDDALEKGTQGFSEVTGALKSGLRKAMDDKKN